MTTAGTLVTQTPVTTVLFQPGQRQPAQTLICAATLPSGAAGSAVYVDTTPQLSSSQGFVLNPGAVLPWAAGLPCYLACPTGSAFVTTSDNQAFTYFDPAGLAAAIVGPGTLATQIASAIYVQGVPPVDNPAILLKDLNRVLTPGNPYTAFPIINTSAYASLRIGFGETGNSVVGVLRQITLNWYADAALSFYLGTDNLVPSTAGGRVLATIATRGPYLQVYYYGAATAVNGSLSITIAGSYRSISLPRIYIDTGVAPTLTVTQEAMGTSTGYASGTIATNTTQSWWPNQYAGVAYVKIRIGALAVVTELDVLDAGTGARIETISMAVNAAPQAYEAICLIGTRQVEVRLPNGANGSVTYGITMEYAGAFN